VNLGRGWTTVRVKALDVIPPSFTTAIRLIPVTKVKSGGTVAVRFAELMNVVWSGMESHVTEDAGVKFAPTKLGVAADPSP
jgi:hypothetical protein